MEKILIELGFKKISDNIYKHEELGIMGFDNEDSKDDIIRKIYNRG